MPESSLALSSSCVRTGDLMPEVLEVTAPYPGLRPFEPHEAEIFFGRENHVDRLLEILQKTRFLAVIGPSGCGKSSLVRAGMLPALAAGWLGTGSDWRIVTMRPGDRPLRRLATGLLEPAALEEQLLPGNNNSDQLETTPALIEAELRRGPLGLVHLVEDLRARIASPTNFNLLVLVDQFEEIFRYSERGAAQGDEADAFVNLLLASYRAAEAPIYVVITMRTDFLGNCTRFLELPDAINHAQYLTPRLSRDQLEQAITGPGRVFRGDVAPEVVNEMINVIAGDPDQLPILQHALARMWDEAQKRQPDSPTITRADLLATGGIAGALSRHGDAILADLRSQSADFVSLAEVLFRTITERGTPESGGRDTRRPVPLARIAEIAGRRWQEFVPVITAFAREGVNFLVHGQPLDAEAIIDISHEALIRQWRQLQDWVADEAGRADDYRRWRDRAADWKKGGELLAGADRSRALEWQAGRDGWQPRPSWAARYALATGAVAQEEFEKVRSYIDESEKRARQEQRAREAAAQRQRQLEQERLEADKRAAEAQAEFERQRAADERDKAEAAAREQVLAERLAERLARKSKRLSRVALVVACIAVGLAIWGFIERTRANKKAQEAQARQLGTEAIGYITQNPELSMLLAAEAYGTSPIDTTESVLRQVFARYNSMFGLMQGHRGGVGHAAFSPDGKLVVTASGDKTARLWDVARGQALQVLSGHQARVLYAAFSPDGKLVVTASTDNTARLWVCRVCAPAAALIADIRRRVKRPLSPQERLASGLPAIGGSPER
jgi:energy-coupling factor transporter ATP-binding protein EcfA2